MTLETPSDLSAFAAMGEQISAPDGTCLFQPGDESGAFLIVTQGSVRVEQTNIGGRTVVLYRVAPGDSCVLTTTCLLSGRSYPGYGYAEGQVSAIAISPEKFRDLMGRDRVFQNLVFQSFADRVGEFTDVIDDLLEHRTDLRLARWLARHGRADIHMTQQELAQELGTAREVVSRSLKAFERRGWIALARGVIHLRDAPALARHGEQVEH